MIASADTMKGASRRPVAADRALDDALDNTFPASDPIASLEPVPSDPDRPVVESTVEARQGVTGHNVRYVLIYSLIGIVVAFAVVYLAYRA